jgi:hypothetical protein
MLQRQRWQERRHNYGTNATGSSSSSTTNHQQQQQYRSHHQQQQQQLRAQQQEQQRQQRQRNTLRRSRSAAGGRHPAPVRVAQPLLGANHLSSSNSNSSSSSSNYTNNTSNRHNQRISFRNPSALGSAASTKRSIVNQNNNNNNINAMKNKIKQNNTHMNMNNKSAVPNNDNSGVLQCTSGAFVASQHGHACGAVSAPGLKPSKPGWKNQDSFLLMENFTHDGSNSGGGSSSKLKESVSLLGVFDGHGPNGRDVSGFCRDNISWVLQDCSVKPPFGPATAPLISNSFLRLDKELRHNIKTSHSGSTGVVVLLSSDVIVVSHVGDSRMCVGQVHRSLQNNRQIKVVQLTSDHKPERRDEHMRIRSSGGRVGPSSHAVGRSSCCCCCCCCCCWVGVAGSVLLCLPFA